jgi:lipopolysaccharide assembly outer membrane protein LptD (OstA)
VIPLHNLGNALRRLAPAGLALLLCAAPLRPRAADDLNDAAASATDSMPPETSASPAPPAIPPKAAPPKLVPAKGVPLQISDVYLSAGTQRRVNDREYVAEGDVLLDTGEYRVQADKIVYDETTGLLEATGKVVFKDATATLYTDHLTYNTVDNTGTAEHVSLYSVPYFITGAKLDKVDKDSYVVHDGELTACTQKHPYWRLKVTRARVDLGDYMYLTNVRLHTGPIPAMWLPFLIYPLKDARTTGMLVPRFGYSNRNGALLSNTFYWAPTGWFDSATTLDLLSHIGAGWGEELRFKPSKDGIGQLNSFYIRDRADLPAQYRNVNIGLDRWTVDYHHYQPFGNHMLAFADVHLVSDPAFYQNFGGEFSSVTRSFNASEARLSQELPALGWILSVRRQQQYFATPFTLPSGVQTFASTALTTWALPSLNFHLNETRLAGSVTAAAEVTADHIRKDVFNGNIPGFVATPFDYSRYDFHPNLTWAALSTPLLKAKFELGGHLTHYTRTADPTYPLIEVDDPLTRKFLLGRALLIGPTFYKLFSGDGGGKWRSSFGATLDFTATSGITGQNRVPVYDVRDLAVPNERLFTLNLSSRLSHKLTEGGSPQERLSADLSLSYSTNQPLTLLPDGRSSKFGPVGLRAGWRVSDRLAFDARYYYSFTAQKADSVSLSGHFEEGAHNGYLDVHFFRVNTVNIAQYQMTQATSISSLTQAIASSQLNVRASRDFFGDHFGIAASVSYDANRREFQDRSLQLRFKAQCATVVTEVLSRKTLGVETRDYRISIDFLGLGNLINTTTSSWQRY